jgi:DNA-directed RNA polymerase subunit alpha
MKKMGYKKLLDLCKVVLNKSTSTKFYGYFKIGPLGRGYGHTIGNSLRRILLSSIGGSVITSVKITGASHEFSVLQGVKEDVTQIILNLKKIRFKLHDITKIEHIYLHSDKAGKVIAKDIELNSNIEIMNPDQEIANVDNNTVLEMNLTVSYGKGYIIADDIDDSSNQEIGTIKLDAMFSPIIKANYEVNNTRIGHNLNYDELTIEIVTDGSITPKEALVNSARILINNLNIFLEDTKIIEDDDNNTTNPNLNTNISTQSSDISKLLQQSIDSIQLSKRIITNLNNAGIYNIEQLIKLTKQDIMAIHNLGKSAVEEIEIILNKLHLSLLKEVN